MDESRVDSVRGRQIVRLPGLALRRQAAAYQHIVVDLGAGDGRWIYRLARAHPAWFCLAVDANAGGMREASFRAGRKPSRGGAANACFVRAAAEALPPALDGFADAVHVHLPWGSLLRAVVTPDVEVLRRIARLGKPGAAFRVRVNASIVHDRDLAARLGVPSLGNEDVGTHLAEGYAAAGIRLETWEWALDPIRTSWGRRLTHQGPVPLLALDGIIGRQVFAREA